MSHPADPAGPAEERHRAPGGWKRALIGFLLGVAAGVVVALILPRDDGPRRVRTPLSDANR